MTKLGSHKEDFKPKYSSSNKNEAFQLLKWEYNRQLYSRQVLSGLTAL
jgi:hypothetical protein